MVSRRRILRELEIINARIDDLVGLITADRYGFPEEILTLDGSSRSVSPPDIARAFDVPLELLGDRPPSRTCDGCGIPLPPSAPFNRCGYCNL